MTAQPSTAKGSDPQPIFETSTGFMRAKHLFVAAELGVFEVPSGTIISNADPHFLHL
jgi:hypothetical protein